MECKAIVRKAKDGWCFIFSRKLDPDILEFLIQVIDIRLGVWFKPGANFIISQTSERIEVVIDPADTLPKEWREAICFYLNKEILVQPEDELKKLAREMRKVIYFSKWLADLVKIRRLNEKGERKVFKSFRKLFGGGSDALSPLTRNGLERMWYWQLQSKENTIFRVLCGI